MNKKLLFVIFLLCLFFIASMLILKRTPLNTSNQSKIADPVTPNITVTVNAIKDSKMNGTMTIREIAGVAAIFLKFPVLPEDNETVQPAYIYEGSCDALGKVMYKLTVPDAGESETDLEINVEQFLKQRPMAIELLKSTNNPSPVACGNI